MFITTRNRYFHSHEQQDNGGCNQLTDLYDPKQIIIYINKLPEQVQNKLLKLDEDNPEASLMCYSLVAGWSYCPSI